MTRRAPTTYTSRTSALLGGLKRRPIESLSLLHTIKTLGRRALGHAMHMFVTGWVAHVHVKIIYRICIVLLIDCYSNDHRVRLL